MLIYIISCPFVDKHFNSCEIVSQSLIIVLPSIFPMFSDLEQLFPFSILLAIYMSSWGGEEEKIYLEPLSESD